MEIQNEIEMKVIDGGKDVQNIFVDICFTLPDNQQDWFVSFDTQAIVTSGSKQIEMALQKTDGEHSNLPNSSPNTDSVSSIMGPWVFNIKIP